MWPGSCLDHTIIFEDSIAWSVQGAGRGYDTRSYMCILSAAKYGSKFRKEECAVKIKHQTSARSGNHLSVFISPGEIPIDAYFGLGVSSAVVRLMKCRLVL